MQNLLHYLENPLKGFAGKTIDEVSAFEEKLGSEEQYLLWESHLRGEDLL